MIHVILVAAIAGQGPAAAEAQTPLTLRKALERAFQMSPVTLRAEEEIRAAEAQRVATKSLVLPRISVSGSLIRNSEDVTFGSGADARTILPLNDWNARVTLQQPIYAGRREFRLYAQSKEGITLAKDGREAARDRIAMRVIADYAAAIQAQALMDVERQGAALAAKRIEQARALFEAGEVTKVDVLRAETANKAALRRVAAAEADSIQARSRLRLALAIDGGDAELGPLDTLTELGLPVVGPETLEERSLHRPEVRQATTNVRIAELEVLKQKGASLPVLTADAAYIQQKSSFPSDGYSQAGLRITVPLFQGGEVGARTRVAEARRRQAELTLAEVRRQATEDVRQSLALLDAARRTKALADDQVAAAEAEYAQARDLYEQREATALDVEAAESALSEARRGVVQARFAVLQAEASVWLAAGALADTALENFK